MGVSYGILFRKEHYLTYARIQDIHLTRDLFERWLGIGSVQIQTASGSASPEVGIVGTDQFDAIRDYLYIRMRGAREHRDPTHPAGAAAPAIVGDSEKVASALREVAAGLREAAAAIRGGDPMLEPEAPPRVVPAVGARYKPPGRIVRALEPFLKLPVEPPRVPEGRTTRASSARLPTI